MNKAIAVQAKSALQKEIARRNLPPGLIAFLMPQLAVETAGFNSKLAAHNNLSGIIYAAQPLAYNTGIKKPKGEAPGTYAGYTTINKWAADYIDTLTRNFPLTLHAKTFAEFTAALKNGRGGRQYMEAEESTYLKALRSWIPQLSKMFGDINFSASAVIPVILVIAVLTYFLTK